MNEEEIKKAFESDPYFAAIMCFIFFGLPDWNISQNDKIQEMIENIGGNENV